MDLDKLQVNLSWLITLEVDNLYDKSIAYDNVLEFKELVSDLCSVTSIFIIYASAFRKCIYTLNMVYRVKSS